MTGRDGAHLVLAVDLDGAGAHPAAWRDPAVRPGELFGPRPWVEAARTAERGLLDLVTFADGFGIQSDGIELDHRTDRVRGRLDAVLVASLVAPLTRHIGLVPVATTTYTEPFHLASAISTLDHASSGRAGWQVRVTARPSDADLVGVQPALLPALGGVIDLDDPAIARGGQALFDEAADAIEVVRRLWDSWEDDAIIRDVATGRFVDRDKLHYVDFVGERFSVKGPSIVPRPPQGQPLVAVLAHQRVPFELAARGADVVFVTPADRDGVADRLVDIRRAERAVGRTGAPLLVVADLEVHLAATSAAASRRRADLDELAGAAAASDAAVFVGTPGDLADVLADWRAAGIDGVRLRPGVVAHDLPLVADGLVPVLQSRGAFRTAYEPGSLRERLGLGRPASRYERSVA
jgi:alkanesulfonate monooxygenase SsuD/methylene tetrahydromethanopterin reductase-like flavin-dependent oxidoreductase (luciferase family)